MISLVKLLIEEFQRAVEPLDPPWEILDENRWLAARHGLKAKLLDHASGERRAVRKMTEALLERLAPHARDLRCEEQLGGIRELLRSGNGALRQQMVYEANHDLREVMAEIIAATA